MFPNAAYRLSFCLCLGAVPAAGEELGSTPPVMGACKPMTTDSYSFPEKVSWTYDPSTNSGTATVVDSYGDSFEGTVEGMRRHNEWFKFSIIFKEEFSSRSEVTIFHAVDSYQMGEAAYDDIDGTMFLASMSGFVEANCVVQ